MAYHYSTPVIGLAHPVSISRETRIESTADAREDTRGVWFDLGDAAWPQANYLGRHYGMWWGSAGTWK